MLPHELSRYFIDIHESCYEWLLLKNLTWVRFISVSAHHVAPSKLCWLLLILVKLAGEASYEKIWVPLTVTITRSYWIFQWQFLLFFTKKYLSVWILTWIIASTIFCYGYSTALLFLHLGDRRVFCWSWSSAPRKPWGNWTTYSTGAWRRSSSAMAVTQERRHKQQPHRRPQLQKQHRKEGMTQR